MGEGTLKCYKGMVMTDEQLQPRMVAREWKRRGCKACDSPNSYNSNPLPPTSNGDSKQETVPTLHEPTYIQDRTKEMPTLSFSPMTTIEIEPVVQATSPAVMNELADSHVFEKEIRGLVDPKGIHVQAEERCSWLQEGIPHTELDSNGSMMERCNFCSRVWSVDDFDTDVCHTQANNDIVLCVSILAGSIQSI